MVTTIKRMKPTVRFMCYSYSVQLPPTNWAKWWICQTDDYHDVNDMNLMEKVMMMRLMVRLTMGKDFELNVQGWAGAGLWARTRLFRGGTLRFVFVFKLCMWSHSNSGKVCRICFSCKLSCLFLLDQKLQFYKIPLSNFKRAWDVWQNCVSS